MHLFSPFNAGGIIRARSPLLYFFSLFKSHFPPRKRIRERRKPTVGEDLSLSLSLSLHKRILSHANTPFANISIDSPSALLCGVLGVGVNLPAGDSSSDSSGRTSRFQYRYNSIRKCAGGRKPRNDHFGEFSNPPLLLPLLFLLVMTLNSEAKYSSGGGGDPLGSSILLSQQKGRDKKKRQQLFKKKKEILCSCVNISRELSTSVLSTICVRVVARNNSRRYRD
jgi:hypothetical protein